MKARFVLISLVFATVFIVSACAEQSETGSTVPDAAPAESAPQAEPVDILGPFVSSQFPGSILMRSELFDETDLNALYSGAEVIEVNLSNGEEYLITSEGTYRLSGTYTDTSVVVDAGDDDRIELIIDNLTITNENLPAIHVKDAEAVSLILEGANSFTTMQAIPEGDKKRDAVVFTRSDLIIKGDGTLDVSSGVNDGIVSKDGLKIIGGALTIDTEEDAVKANDFLNIFAGSLVINAGDDAIHSENEDNPELGYAYIHGGSLDITAGDDAIRGSRLVQVDGGEILIRSSQEGIEATAVQINGGTIDIYATDDGINAAEKAPGEIFIEVTGGEISIDMASGDTDALDSNGDLIISGGTFDITARSAFDADGEVTHTGGDITVNGEKVTEIRVQHFGWRG